ncbi:MAG: hypothetical protein RIB03_11015 [Henriciella sp.]|uniref:hypothetical protein n=1 Tax=Henriciella sp. TaxID=1968823 RepID=UPI0032EDFF37
MTIKRLIASLGMTGIAAAVIPMAQAQDEGPIPAVYIGDLDGFSTAEKMAYAIGAVQTMAYMEATTSEDYALAACIAGQERVAYQTLIAGDADDLAAIEIEASVQEACENETNESTGTLLRASDADEWFGGGRSETERAMFVLGLSDITFFRVYTRVDEEVSTCVREMTQVIMTADNAFSESFLEAPSDPLVEDLVDKPVNVCLE